MVSTSKFKLLCYLQAFALLDSIVPIPLFSVKYAQYCGIVTNKKPSNYQQAFIHFSFGFT